MSLVCYCNCHVFRFTRLRRQKVILIEKNTEFFSGHCFYFIIIDKKRLHEKDVEVNLGENSAKIEMNSKHHWTLEFVCVCRRRRQCAALLIRANRLLKQLMSRIN